MKEHLGFHYDSDGEDWTTSDGHTFYQSGKQVLKVDPNLSDKELWRKINAKMEKDGFWPNIWYISDHGNVSLMKPPKVRKRK